MIHLKWLGGGWRYDAGIITARFDNGVVVEIPVGKSRNGAFFITRVGEHEWRIAPVRCPNNCREAFDKDGRINEFVHLSGGDDATHERINQI